MAIIDAIGNVISAGLGYFGARKDAEIQEKMAEKNIALQREFAQTGVQWKVEDAKKAGIHPLYALGAQTHSFSPVSVGSDYGTAFARAGQDLSRAMHNTRSAFQREDAYSSTLKALQLERGKLENDVLKADLASKLARLNQQSGPPIPSSGVSSDGITKTDVPTIKVFGEDVRRNPALFSAAQAVQDEFGEVGEFVVSTPALVEAMTRGQDTGWRTGARDIGRWVDDRVNNWWSDANDRYMSGGRF